MFISTIVAFLSAVVAYASPIQFEERAGVVPPQGFNMYVTGPDKNILLLTFCIVPACLCFILLSLRRAHRFVSLSFSGVNGSGCPAGSAYYVLSGT
jgi:hypothetical protein